MVLWGGGGGGGTYLTQLLHRSVKWEEALFKELVHHFIIFCLDLRDHVTGDQTHSVSDLCPVEAICVFVPKHLKEQVSELKDGYSESDRLAADSTYYLFFFQAHETETVVICSHLFIG